MRWKAVWMHYEAREFSEPKRYEAHENGFDFLVSKNENTQKWEWQYGPENSGVLEEGEETTRDMAKKAAYVAFRNRAIEQKP